MLQKIREGERLQERARERIVAASISSLYLVRPEPIARTLVRRALSLFDGRHFRHRNRSPQQIKPVLINALKSTITPGLSEELRIG